MEAFLAFLFFFTLSALIYISYYSPFTQLTTFETTLEGFESSNIDTKAEKETAGIAKYIDSNELYDTFYASVYDQLTQGSVRTQAEIGLMLHEWTKKGEDLKTFQVLDGGCGTGIATSALAKMNVKKVVGLDKSEAMLKQAKDVNLEQSTLKKEQKDKIEWRKADLNDPSSCSPGEFTHSFLMYFTLYYFNDKEALLRNMYLWTSAGGKMVLSVVNKHKFDPMLESSAPWIGFSLQKYSKERITKSEVNFNKFKYTGEFDLMDPAAEFRETFRFSDSTVRRQRHAFRMEDISEIVKLAKLAGWKYNGFVDLTPIGFEYAYHLHFSK